MTIETTILLVCAAVFMLLVLLIMSLEGAVKRAVRENLRSATTDTREKLEGLARNVADMQGPMRNSTDELANLRRATDALETQTAKTESELDRLAETLHAKLAEVDRSRTDSAAELGRISDRLSGQQDAARAQAEAIGLLQGDLQGVTAKMDSLRDYLENVFQRDLQGAMRNFDNTVCSVLGEMKSELMQGVHRIETLESAVIDRQNATRKLLESEMKTINILEHAGETDTETSESAAEPAALPAEDEAPAATETENAAETETDAETAETGSETPETTADDIAGEAPTDNAEGSETDSEAAEKATEAAEERAAEDDQMEPAAPETEDTPEPVQSDDAADLPVEEPEPAADAEDAKDEPAPEAPTAPEEEPTPEELPAAAEEPAPDDSVPGKQVAENAARAASGATAGEVDTAEEATEAPAAEEGGEKDAAEDGDDWTLEKLAQLVKDSGSQS